MAIKELEPKEFHNLFRILNILKETCDNVIINNGQICQRSNSNELIYKFDLSSLLGDNMNIIFSSLKKKLDLLKCFNNKENVFIKSEENNIDIYDSISKISFKNPSPDLLVKNKFISDESFKIMFDYIEEDCILETLLNKTIIDRIKSIGNSFDLSQIKILLSKNSAELIGKTLNGNQTASFISNIVLNKEFNNESINVVLENFLIDHDVDLSFKVYLNENICTNKIETKINENLIIVYSRSMLEEKNE